MEKANTQNSSFHLAVSYSFISPIPHSLGNPQFPCCTPLYNCLSLSSSPFQTKTETSGIMSESNKSSPAKRSRRRASPLQRKVKRLKKLVPSREAVGLEGLFRETAEYILCLQMRVKVMQVMVKVLTAPDE
ncbi:hypothetical protein GQ457_18G022280 [Hibiscus cannabinus]